MEVESEIRNSVLAGNMATVHENKLEFHGWVGSGYVLMDAATGAAAYKISGGMNGSSTAIRAALDKLFLYLSLGSEVLEEFFVNGPFAIIQKAIAVVSAASAILGAILDCSGLDIFVVLLPTLLSVIWLAIIGSLALFIIYRLLLTLVIGIFSLHATSQLTEARCEQ